MFGAILDILVVSAPDPAGPNAGFAALDGAGAGTSRHCPRIRKGGAQLPLGISPYPGRSRCPEACGGRAGRWLPILYFGKPEGREGALSRPSLVQGRRNAPGQSRPAHGAIWPSPGIRRCALFSGTSV